MSNILPIGEENGSVGQRDERFQNTHDSGPASQLVHAKRTDSPFSPENTNSRPVTYEEGELTYA
jgi:hypothetical protein